MQLTLARDEFSFSEYAILGIDPHVAPNKTPPICLSEPVQQHWRFLMNDNLQSFLFKMNSFTAWDRILDVVFRWSNANGKDYLSRSFSSRSTQNKLTRIFNRRRSRLVQVVDRTELFDRDDVEILYYHNNLELLPQSDGHPTIQVVTHVRLYSKDPLSVLKWLGTETRFNRQGTSWKYSGALDGVHIQIKRKGLRGMIFTTWVNGGKLHVPEYLVTPTPAVEEYHEYILDDIWMPSVRRHRYRTVGIRYQF